MLRIMIGNTSESANECKKRLSFFRPSQYRKGRSLHDFIYYHIKHMPFKRHSYHNIYKSLSYMEETTLSSYRTLKNSSYRSRKSTLRRQYANT